MVVSCNLLGSRREKKDPILRLEAQTDPSHFKFALDWSTITLDPARLVNKITRKKN
jgi:hypothetical protein